MLVLSRKIGEKVVIPGLGIEVRVIDVRPNGKVSLGFTAPPDVPIMRSEVVNRQPPAKDE